MNVAELVGVTLFQLGVRQVFGVVGSGNFHVTNALVAAGARFVPAAHEGGAATMADAYARLSGEVCAVTVHQGPGFTNALTGLVEAAKSRSRLIALVPEVGDPLSNFYLDLAGAAAACGIDFFRVCGKSPSEEITQAFQSATTGAVILALPLDVQQSCAELTEVELPVEPASTVDVTDLVAALRRAQRPVFIAGRGARSAATLTALADKCGALLATSAAAKGLFTGNPWNLDVSGGFASPLAAALIAESDLIVAWGCRLNQWTTRHGRLIGPHATVVQVDHDAAGISSRADLAVIGDVDAVAGAAAAGEWQQIGWRANELGSVRWRDVSYADESGPDTVDPRTLTIALDDMLPAERVVCVDSGNFMGYPSMYLSIPDRQGFCFTQAYQSIGLGLATSIGAALARPDRLTVAALGDGGFLMSAAELATVSRLGLPMVIVVYNDAAYGAEVHHFGPQGHPLQTVVFPDTDIAAIGRGYGLDGLTVRTRADLAGVQDWLDGPRDVALVVDAKVRSSGGSWWLEEAFRAH